MNVKRNVIVISGVDKVNFEIFFSLSETGSLGEELCLKQVHSERNLFAIIISP